MNQSRARWRRFCSDDGGHRRRDLRGGTGAGAHEGSIAPHVEGRGGRKKRSRRALEAAVERSPSTARLRR
jgi:hypothetical protein